MTGKHALLEPIRKLRHIKVSCKKKG